MSSALYPVRINMWLSKREVGRKHNSYFRRCMGMSQVPVARRRWYRGWDQTLFAHQKQFSHEQHMSETSLDSFWENVYSDTEWQIIDVRILLPILWASSAFITGCPISGRVLSTCLHIHILKVTYHKESKYEPHLHFSGVCQRVKCTHRLISGHSLMFMLCSLYPVYLG